MRKLILFLIFFLQVFIIHAFIRLNENTDVILIDSSNANFNSKGPYPYKFSGYYWIEANIHNNSDRHFILECLSPHIEDLKIFIENAQGKQTTYTLGVKYPFIQRPHKHKNFVVELPRDWSSYKLYIGINPYKNEDLDIRICTNEAFTQYATSEYLFLGIYYGALLMVFFYNLFLYLKGNSSWHLYYAFYIIGCTCISLKEDGMGFQFLWGQFPIFNKLFVNYISKIVYITSFVLYAYNFLEIRNRKLFVYRILVLLTFVYSAEVFLSGVLEYPNYFNQGLLIGILIYIYLLSIKSIFNGNKYALYFTLGFSIVLVSFAINLLRDLGILKSNIFTVYIFNYGIILEVMLFSVALAESIRQIRNEKQKAQNAFITESEKNISLQKRIIIELNEKKEIQEKVNRELEEKVILRTEELTIANKRLEKYAKETEIINSHLDIHNYTLKTAIQEEKLQRIYSAGITYPQFLETYPSDNTCLKVVKELKWKEAGTCHKCGYLLPNIYPLPDKKKCGRCGHIESSTSQTLFHHLKFSLNKAFYITYAEYSQIAITNEALSLELAIRKATVWAFRQKVKLRMNDSKYSTISGWKEIIIDR